MTLNKNKFSIYGIQCTKEDINNGEFESENYNPLSLAIKRILGSQKIEVQLDVFGSSGTLYTNDNEEVYFNLDKPSIAFLKKYRRFTNAQDCNSVGELLKLVEGLEPFTFSIEIEFMDEDAMDDAEASAYASFRKKLEDIGQKILFENIANFKPIGRLKPVKLIGV